MVLIVYSDLVMMTFTVLSDDVSSRPISHWIVADLDTVDGRALLYSAIKQLVPFIFCCKDTLMQRSLILDVDICLI